MTTVELAMRLCRDLDVSDLGLLSADGRVDLVDAMNTALQKHHALSPDHLKITPASVTLKEPVTISINVTDGSSTFTGFTPDEDQMFCSVRIQGDEDIDHQIISTTEFLDTYKGVSGLKTAVLYYDVITFYQPIERIATRPRIEGASWRMEEFDRNRWTEQLLRNRKGIGRPRYYFPENTGINNDGEAAFLLRMDVLPDQLYRLRMDVQMAPKIITFDDLVTPITLPIRRDHIESVLLPLARNELTESPLWKDKDKINRIKDKSIVAERYFELAAVVQTTPNKNRVGTRRRF